MRLLNTYRGSKCGLVSMAASNQLNKQGWKSKLIVGNGWVEVWTNKPEPEASKFGRLMEPEWVTEACQTEDGERAIDAGETHAPTASEIVRREWREKHSTF